MMDYSPDLNVSRQLGELAMAMRKIADALQEIARAIARLEKP